MRRLAWQAEGPTMRFIPAFALALFAFAAPVAILVATPAYAAGAAVPDNYAPLIEQAKKDGLTVIVIAPPSPVEEKAKTMPDDMTGIGLLLREEVRRLVTTAPDMPGRIASAMEIISPDGSLRWLAYSLILALAGIAIGHVPRRLIGIWGNEHFRYMWNPNPRDAGERIGYLLFRSALQLVYTALVFAVAMLVAIVFDTGHAASRATIFVIVSGFCLWRIAREVIGFNLIAHDVPSHRMLNLPDTDANAMFRDLQWVSALAIAVIGVAVWFGDLDLDGDAHKLILILASLIAAAVIGRMTLKYRRAIAGAILGAGDGDAKPFWRRFLAGGWHVFALVYLVVATVVSIVRLLLNLPSANLLSAVPAIAFIAALALYGVFYLLIDKVFAGRRAAFERRLRAGIEQENRRREAAGGRSGAAELLMGEETIVPGAMPAAAYVPVFLPLARQAAALAVTLAAIGFVAAAWGVGAMGGEAVGAGLMKTLGVTFLAWVGYRAISISVAAKLAEEGAPPPGGLRDEDAPPIQGATRLGTILPLIRILVVSIIVSVAGMIVLSGLGIDVSPLFAGAGVVGLAVGFGAQALIRDIFSGFFFLVDDAFRVGEYVEMGDLRGTVEKISLRSFQLRHHNGPLHTVPFGEIKQLTNHSRDWVIMKLPLRLTFDTDVERVRKLLKKLGQDLLQHPEIGANFLQPLKSQGVVEIDDSALIVRVKFMTRPDDQWVTRKVVYASIQELFRKEGIRFANREVTVRIAGEEGRPDPVRRRKAATAAAEIAVAASGAKAGAGPDD